MFSDTKNRSKYFLTFSTFTRTDVACKPPFDGKCTLSRVSLKSTIIYSKQREGCSFVGWEDIAKDLQRLLTVLVYSRPLYSKQ